MKLLKSVLRPGRALCRLALLICACGFSIVASSQNLVMNGDFEAYNKCPDNLSNIEQDSGFTRFPFVQHWVRPTPATSDYFNSCALDPRSGVPDNFFGHQSARSGSGYAGLYTYNYQTGLDYREFITTKLSRRLTKDSLYCARFFVSSAFLRSTSVTFVAVKEIGASFTDTFPKGVGMGLLPLPYHIAHDTAIGLADTGRWYEISGTFIARGGERWMTIGCLGTKAVPFTYLGGPASSPYLYSYCYIDDVSVLPAPRNEFVHMDTLCDSLLTLTSTQAQGPYRWNTGDTGRSITVSQPGHYNCRVMGNCSDHYDRFIVSPQLPFDSVHDTLVICPTNRPFAELNAAQDSGIYLWNTGAVSRTLRVNQPGIYTATTRKDCKVYSDRFIVLADSAARPTFIRDTTICQHVTAPRLNVHGSGLIWYSSAASDSGQANQPDIRTDKPGSQTLYIARQERSCISRKVPLTVTVKSLPSAHVPETIWGCTDGTQRYRIIGTEEEQDVTFTWNTGDLSCCIIPQSEGMYTRSATNACATMIDTFYLRSRQCDSCLAFPNAFSPNGDGRNEGFRAMELCPIREFHLEVYNRWGEVVFRSDKVSDRWNGQHRGKAAPSGTYMYFASYTTELSDRKFVSKGSITLFR